MRGRHNPPIDSSLESWLNESGDNVVIYVDFGSDVILSVKLIARIV